MDDNQSEKIPFYKDLHIKYFKGLLFDMKK